MENIVNFPSKEIRDWVIVERSTRNALTTAGMPENVQKIVVDHMKSFWDVLQHDFDLTFNGNLSDPYLPTMKENIRVALKEQINAFTEKLFIDRLHREIDSCHELGLL